MKVLKLNKIYQLKQIYKFYENSLWWISINVIGWKCINVIRMFKCDKISSHIKIHEYDGDALKSDEKFTIFIKVHYFDNIQDFDENFSLR